MKRLGICLAAAFSLILWTLVPGSARAGILVCHTETVAKIASGDVSIKKVCIWSSDSNGKGGPAPIDWTAVMNAISLKGCEDAKKAGELDPSATCAPAGASASAAANKVADAVRTALASLQIPQTEINIGPDPSVNEWNMVAVGEPIWLWGAEATSLSNTVTTDGITVTINAQRGNLTFDMGDGTTLTCATATPRPPRLQTLPRSPDCGHVYQKKNKQMPITASATWQINWTAGEFYGGLIFQMGASRTIDVGELRAVITYVPTTKP